MATQAAPITNFMYKPTTQGVVKVDTTPTEVSGDKAPTKQPLLTITVYTVISAGSVFHIHAYVNRNLQFKINIKSLITTPRATRRAVLEKYSLDKTAVSEPVAFRQFAEWLGRFNTKSILAGDSKDVLIIQDKLREYTGTLPVAKHTLDLTSYMIGRLGGNPVTYQLPNPDSSPSLWEYVDAYIRNPQVK